MGPHSRPQGDEQDAMVYSRTVLCMWADRIVGLCWTVIARLRHTGEKNLGEHVDGEIRVSFLKASPYLKYADIDARVTLHNSLSELDAIACIGRRYCSTGHSNRTGE